MQGLLREMAERMDKLEKVHEEDQTKLVELQANLCDVEAKLAALKKTHDEDQVKLNQQIQDLQKGNVFLQGEKEKLARKMAELG